MNFEDVEFDDFFCLFILYRGRWVGIRSTSLFWRIRGLLIVSECYGNFFILDKLI